MSLVTGSLLGKLERQWSMTGLTPFRYWYPKKVSSHQCSVTYSRGQERGLLGLETASRDPTLDRVPGKQSISLSSLPYSCPLPEKGEVV